MRNAETKITGQKHHTVITTLKRGKQASQQKLDTENGQEVSSWHYWFGGEGNNTKMEKGGKNPLFRLENPA